VDTVVDVMKLVGRKSRPELVSMDLCFATDPSLNKVDLNDKGLLPKLLRAKAVLRKRHGMSPHIGQVIRLACAS
jgi:hypothetical protein